MNGDHYDGAAGPDERGEVGRFPEFFVGPDEAERRGRLLRQVTFTQAHDGGEVIEFRSTNADRMTPWLRTALANLLGLSRAGLLLLLDAAGCVVVVLLLAMVWRWLT
ncbi:MAG TPA: hypothetical protein VGL39_28125 [Jatrophihabitantaceae bacterium]|jgi:hypothetical protein